MKIVPVSFQKNDEFDPMFMVFLFNIIVFLSTSKNFSKGHGYFIETLQVNWFLLQVD